MPQPTLHLMVGLPGSGKTTLARQIAKQEQAIRLTPDEWQLQLFGDDTDHPEHDHRHSTIEKIMWDLAVQLLKGGTSVILDYGFWAREERQHFYDQAKLLGAWFCIHHLDVPGEELVRRVLARNASPAEPAFTILPAHMAEWMKIYQPVTRQELQVYQDLMPPDARDEGSKHRET